MSSSPQSRPCFVSEEGEAYEVDEVYRTHGRWLIGFLRRRFGFHAAEELAQETYLRLARANAPIRNPRALLAKVATNAARDLARRRAVRPTFIASGSAEPAACEAVQAEAVLIKQVVLALPPKLQEVFVLSRFGGLTYEQIARRCRISVKTVEARMSRALAICSAMMD